jgi:hypothetical protein
MENIGKDVLSPGIEGTYGICGPSPSFFLLAFGFGRTTGAAMGRPSFRISPLPAPRPRPAPRPDGAKTGAPVTVTAGRGAIGWGRGATGWPGEVLDVGAGVGAGRITAGATGAGMVEGCEPASAGVACVGTMGATGGGLPDGLGTGGLWLGFKAHVAGSPAGRSSAANPSKSAASPVLDIVDTDVGVDAGNSTSILAADNCGSLKTLTVKYNQQNARQTITNKVVTIYFES